MLYPLASVQYVKKIGVHNFNFLALPEQTTREFSSGVSSRRELFTTSIHELFMGNEHEQTNTGSSGSDIGRKHFVSRLNYRYEYCY